MNKFYFKLVGIILITALLITVSTLFYIRIKIQNEKSVLLHPGYNKFLFYLVKEIGASPEREKLMQIANDNNLKIQIKSENSIINSDNTFFSSEEFFNLKVKKSKRYKRRFDTKKPVPKEVAIYFSDHHPVGIEYSIFRKKYLFIKVPNKSKQTAANYAIASIILFFLLIAGLLIKKSFVDPLRKLEEAISCFSKNIYDDSKVSSTGELKNLFNAFNQMKKDVANHIDEKERLLRDISHDLRSPITRMKVALELMDESKIKSKIITDVNELSSLVNQILESQTEKAFQLEEINCEDFLTEYIQSHNFQLNISLDTIENFYFHGNKKQLKRILNNLIDNSYKYANNKNGVVISTLNKNEKGIFIVSDSDSGIKNQIIDKIFQPFFKNDIARRQDEKTGSGLGLTITKNLVQSMNGEIKAYPSKDNGLTIEFSFPILK